MNYILQQIFFYQHIEKDPRIKPLHISLYMALFQVWNARHFPPSFIVARTRLMQKSKIGSKATFAKTMRELNELGYISYTPPMKTVVVHELNCCSPESETGLVPKVEHIDKVLKPKTRLNNKEIITYPSEEEVKNWFLEKNESAALALTFFYYYSANGWMMGNYAMKDWRAAAAKWIITTKTTTYNANAKYVHTNKRKDYSKPL